jgi:prolyl oligopeptidase
MPHVVAAVPFSPMEAVTEILHGVPVSDPYRWLEDQNSLRTRQWIADQTEYARAYLDRVSGRAEIRKRIRELLAIETHDSIHKAGNRYFFRKRLADQEQPCLYMREGAEGQDELLIDPAEFGDGPHTAIKLRRVSNDGRLVLYEIKQGGERMGSFALFDVEKRQTLSDKLPRGYLRGFAFAPDGRSFYYVHEPAETRGHLRRTAFRHVLGTPFEEDQEVFCAGEGTSVGLFLVSDSVSLGFLVYRFLEKTTTSFYLAHLHSAEKPECVVPVTEDRFGPYLVDGRVLAITDRDAPNLRIIELRRDADRAPEWVDTVPETEWRIQQWAVAGDRILVLSAKSMQRRLQSFELTGRIHSEQAILPNETVRILGGAPESDEFFLERESFTEPIRVARYSPAQNRSSLWSERAVPFDPRGYSFEQVEFTAKDGTAIPMYLVGRKEVLAGGCHAAIMTSYGGYGVAMTPQFSVFVAFLLERGCLFALPNIRGGSEFGSAWHEAAKRRSRQTAFDDFLSGAEWLIATGRTNSDRVAIFGGSNSGLLVGAAMTQRPDLFRAAVCMVPMLDMLRYHLFDNAHVWKEEFGTADDELDFPALYAYSPYHRVRDRVRYPATLLVSGDADQNCNPLHARKMTARLQAANRSEHPILLDYSPWRGHSPVLPLSQRVEALTDRMAFLCHELGLSA